MKTSSVCSSAILSLAAALFTSPGSFAQEPRLPKAASAEADTPAASEVLAAQFQATFYEVQAASNRISSLDAKSLTGQAATPEALLQALGEVGTARILYRIAQPVNVFSERIHVGTSEPVVVGSRRSATGEAINSVRYQNVGVMVRLSAQAQPKGANGGQPAVNMSVQLAAIAPSDTEIAPGVKATATRSIAVDHSELLEYDRPLVMLAISSSSATEQTTPAVYVVRYLFSRAK